MKDGETPEPGSLSEPGAHQSVSVLGIALIAMGEDIGAEMALRTFNHLVRDNLLWSEMALRTFTDAVKEMCTVNIQCSLAPPPPPSL